MNIKNIPNMTCLMLAFCLLLALTAPAIAEEMSNQESMARSNLTEVYGYEGDDPEQFVFEDDGKGLLKYWHENHPEWLYTMNYDLTSGAWREAHSPFYNDQNIRYPGESAIRYALNRAEENKWFSNWNEDSMQGLWDAINGFGNIKMNTNLTAGLIAKDITAAQAIQEFFLSCHGEEYLWTDATKQWRDLILKENNLKLDAPYALPEGKPIHLSLEDSFPSDVWQFTKTIPVPLEQAMKHPKLAGWNLLSGALSERHNAINEIRGIGLAAFEKEGRRLLVMFIKETDSPDYLTVPVGEHVLYTDRALTISSKNASAQMQIAYEPKDGLEESFTVVPVLYGEGETACVIQRYISYERNTNQYFLAEPGVNGWRLTQSQADNEPELVSLDAPVVANLEGIPDIEAFPKSLAAFKALSESPIPEGYTMLHSVNLRKSTSSRSASLGIMNTGTLAKILGQEPGDPHPWLHAKVGSKEGYASMVYVSLNGGATSMYYAKPLSMGKAKKDLALKTGTGIFDGKAMDLKAGTKMHIITEQNGWLYVVVPQGDIGWFMDVNGTYGYVKQDDVRTASSSLALDWIE